MGIVEERQRLCGMLALRVDQEMPVTVANGGFEFGHALFGTTAFVVLHLVFAFPEFQTYNVLINPHNPLVQAVLRTMLDDGDYFFFALNTQGQITAFRRTSGSKAWPSCAPTVRVCSRPPRRRRNTSRPSRRLPPIPIQQGSAPVGLSRECHSGRPHHASDGVDACVAGRHSATDDCSRGADHVAMVAFMG